MESGAGFCPFWSWLLISTSFLVIAKAEITCRSCQLPAAKPRSEELLWLMKTDTAETGTGFKREIIKYPDGTAGSHFEIYKTHVLDCVAQTSACVLGRGKNIRSVRRKSTGQQHFIRLTRYGLPKNEDHSKVTAAVGEKVSSLRQPEKLAGSKRSLPVISNKANDNHGHRFKRNSLTQGKEGLKSTTLQQDGESKALGDRKVRSASLAEQRLSRAELKWGGDEGKATDSREKELKLTSTTFALTGDSAHNQAMVHWSGHNSSVILILTKLFDFNLGSVTESSLWRSTDYGTTYEKLNDKVGLKTILSYLYVSPNNKRKIMLLTDPEIESSLLISSDEGATYQKYRLSFYILSLLFHPKQEDWILAYSHDLKLYSSVEFGKRWRLVHERVAPNRFYWSVLGLDKEPDLIHLETSVAEGYAQYITCKLQNCTEANKGRPFPGYIDPNSLVVQDEYVFVQVTTGGRPVYYVSYRREGFAQMKLPKYTLPKDMHVISADENRVVAAVQEWNQNNTYNLYVSEARGVFFTLALESVVISREAEGNVMIDLYEVAGINGMFLANKKLEKQVKTYITYNKGRDWRLLQAPVTDARGNDISCLLPYCSLHLHLQVSDNPYASGNIASKESAPGIIVASGSIGSELSHSNVSMFITSDAGNTWRQIFQEEYSVLYLDQGGALVAIKHTPLPIRHLWLSFDEGRAWNKYSFTSVPLFVDGVLGEPGDETLIMTIFGHVSHRSEWQLVKIDFRSIFNRRCTEEEYQTWHLHNQGDPCIMGMKRIYRKLKPTARCVIGRDTSFTMTSEPCLCTEADFECDYGYERHGDGKCLPAFWFNPSSMSRSCSTGNSFLNSTGYRKVVSNNCTAGVKEIYTARKQQCPRRAPQGLHVVTSDGTLTATTGNNVTFLVFLEEGDGSRTSIMLDFGDGNAVSYSNVSSIEDGIKHVYKNVGIFKVTAIGENSLGSDSAVLYLHVTCHLDRVHLSAPFVAVKNKEINLTAVLWPNQVGTVTYIWWFGNNTEPVITLEASVSFTFMREGINTVTVQVSARNEILQDKKTITVHEHFRSQLLAFSSNLDEYNPDVAEWRQDVSKVVKNSLVQATGIAEEQLLVTVLPGLPTAAEFFLLPDKELTEGRAERNTAHLDQCYELTSQPIEINVKRVQDANGEPDGLTIQPRELALQSGGQVNVFWADLSEILLSTLNQNVVQFTLRAGVQVSVYAAHLSAAPLVDTTEGHSGSAMLMLLSVVFVGLAVFIIYKFKRKIPGINVYAQMQNEKEQEMISPVSPIDSTPNNLQRELVTSLELLDKELDTRAIGCIPSHSDRISLDIPIYVNV